MRLAARAPRSFRKFSPGHGANDAPCRPFLRFDAVVYRPDGSESSEDGFVITHGCVFPLSLYSIYLLLAVECNAFYATIQKEQHTGAFYS